MTEQKKLVPKRRFKEFQDTKAWEQRRLGMLSESLEYGLNAAATEYDGNNKYLRITDIDDDTHEFKTNALTSPDIDLETAEKYQLKAGDILFARTGASVGKTYRYKESDGLVYFAGFLIRARIKPEYDSEFVFQSTLTDKYNRFISITSQRSGQPGVNAKEYADFEISVPKLDEQREIGTFFANLDHLITLHQRKLEKTKALKSAYLSEMFPAEGECEPKRRFAGFMQAWEQRKVVEIAPLQRGFDLPVSEMEAGPYPVIMSNGIGAYHSKYKAKAPGVVTGRSGTIGNLAFVEVDYWPHNTALWVTDFKGNDAKFIYYLYQKLGLKRYGTGSGVPTLNRNDVHDTEASIPSVEEQKQISWLFDSLDHLITLHQRKLEKLQSIKKAYLNEVFV